MSRSIRFSLWKSLQAKRIGTGHRSIWNILLPVLLLVGAGLILSIRSSASQISAYVVCARQSPEESPLLYPPGTRLVQVSGRIGRTLEGFGLTSRPHLSYRADRILFSARRDGEEYSQIWSMTTDTGSPSRVAAVSADCVTPALLPDGAIVFAQLDHATEPDRLVSKLFVLRPDGNLVRISFGADLDLVEGILDDGRILVLRYSPLYPEATELALRPDGTELALRPDGTELERFLGDPSANAADRTADDIDRIRPVAGDGHSPVRSPAWLEPGYHILESIRVAPRALPPVSTSVVKPELDYGWLLCLDARLTDLGVSLERAHSVRVLDSGSGESLGEAKVADDGSFYLKVPADRLLRVQLIDERGSVLAGQSDGIWVRPNEHRGCPGCHEPRFLSPENRSPLALEREPASVLGTVSGTVATVRGRP